MIKSSAPAHKNRVRRVSDRIPRTSPCVIGAPSHEPIRRNRKIRQSGTGSVAEENRHLLLDHSLEQGRLGNIELDAVDLIRAGAILLMFGVDRGVHRAILHQHDIGGVVGDDADLLQQAMRHVVAISVG